MTFLSTALSLLLLANTNSASAKYLVRRADLIVRVTAMGYFRPPVMHRAGRGTGSILAPPAEAPAGTIRFHVDEVLKGTWAPETIDVSGRLVTDADFDDFNEGRMGTIAPEHA